MALVRRHAAVRAVVAVKLEMLLQFEALVEGLATDLADGRHLPSVLAHVVHQVLLLAEDVPAHVAFVLDFPRVDGDVLLEAVEAGELAIADGAHEESGVVLDGGSRVIDLGNGVWKKFWLLQNLRYFDKDWTES